MQKQVKRSPSVSMRRRDEMQLAHRTLTSGFVDDALIHSLGGDRNDIGTVVRYLRLPVADRPALSVYFDREFYLSTNPELRDAAIDPLLHFVGTGLLELRAPHPLIDIRHLVATDPRALGQPPRIEALGDLLEYDLANPSPYFDITYYRIELKGEAPSRAMLRHFLTVGARSGRQPNGFFSPAWYAERNTDVPDDLYAATRHFVMFGDREGRRAGPNFDGAAYRSRYPDVLDAAVPPLCHYMINGRFEGRYAASEKVAETVVHTGPAVPVGQSLPIDPEQVAARYAAAASAVAARRAEDESARAYAPPMLMECADVAAGLARLKLSEPRAPRVSIIVQGEDPRRLVECLLSLRQAAAKTAFEVILAEGGEVAAALSAAKNVVHAPGPAGSDRLARANAAFGQCRGAAVLLLDGDTQLLPGALDRLAAAIAADADLAAATPKVIDTDGRLLEAGRVLRPDGGGEPVGHGRHPDEGSHRRDRDVACGSAWALLVRRDRVAGELFDVGYAPGAEAVADLCLRLAASGGRIRFVHGAVAVARPPTPPVDDRARARRALADGHRLAARWGERIRAVDRVRPIAFHLPQFHSVPENDAWWGAGFTEWTNVAKARPCYAGHYQPHLPADLGFYDLTTPQALRRQALLAARYGVEGFCVYAYNFDGRPMLAEPLDIVRAAPDLPFRYCLCWANENWTRNWDGGAREILREQSYDAVTIRRVIADAVAHAGDPRYLRVNGAPLFLVYRPLLIPDPRDFARACRAAFAAAGLAGVHLVYVESMEAVGRKLHPADLGFDACVEFPPQGRGVPSATDAEIIQDGWSGFRYDYPATLAADVARSSAPYLRYPAVFPSWDNTPRQGLRGTCFDNASPEAFQLYVEEKVEEVRRFHVGDERLLFVNAWNEWAEGAHLEPDTGYGHRWLEALRDGVADRRRA